MRFEPRLLIWSSTRACAPRADGDHRDHRADADDDAEHRQHRAQLVDAQRRERDSERGEEVHGCALAPRTVAPEGCRLAWGGPAGAGRRSVAALRRRERRGVPWHVRRVAREPAVAERSDAARRRPRCRCSCVTTMIVMPPRLSSCSSAMTSRLVAESSAPVGSSARMSLGSLTSARAMATRCCWPPESCAGLWRSRVASPTCASFSRALGVTQRPRARPRRAAAARRFPAPTCAAAG